MSQKTKKLDFVSGWHSDRGFVNEGFYFYGTVNEFEELHELSCTKNDTRILRYHRSLNSAKNKACALTRRAIKSDKAWGTGSYYRAKSIRGIVEHVYRKKYDYKRNGEKKCHKQLNPKNIISIMM